MVDTRNRLFPVHRGPFAVDTLRGAAILLVVFYHVVGSSPESGLHIASGTLRVLNDMLNDIHMPLFAAMAGLVYAIRPPSTDNLPRFMTGKLKRLAVPGLVAIALFAVSALVLGETDRVPRSLPGAVFLPYLHFWFLQALLVVFAVYAPVDALTRGRCSGLVVLAAGALLVSGWRPSTPVMSLPSAIWLLFYFSGGVFIWRRRDILLRNRRWFLSAAVLATLVGTAMFLSPVLHGKPVPRSVSDVQSLLLASGLCVAALLATRDQPWLEWLAAPSFVIYLYHIFGVSGTRLLLHTAGIHGLLPHLVAGTLMGVLVPLVLYLVALRSDWLGLLVLGQAPARRRVGERRPPSLQETLLR